VEILPKYNLAIFDFDGTIADTFSITMQIAKKLTQDFNYEPITSQQWQDLREIGILQVIKKYKFPLWRIPEVGRELHKEMHRNIHKISLFDGMAAVLKELFEHSIQLGLVSSNGGDNIQKVLGDEIASYFSFVECGVSMFSKQAKFEKVLKASQVNANQAICIGDEIRDIQAARKAKIPFGAVSWGYTNIEKLLAHFPQEVFHNVTDISKKLLIPSAIK